MVLFLYMARVPSCLSCYVAVLLKLRIIVVTSALYHIMDAVADDRVATAIIFPTCIEGTDGIVAACCTKASSITQRRHTRLDDGSISDSPSWLLYQCYLYAGMSLLNWGGMTDPPFSIVAASRLIRRVSHRPVQYPRW